jgi:hypothetical protein
MCWIIKYQFFQYKMQNCWAAVTYETQMVSDYHFNLWNYCNIKYCSLYCQTHRIACSYSVLYMHFSDLSQDRWLQNVYGIKTKYFLVS